MALAQTMSYYNFPETGEGRNKYSWGGNNGTDLELDFAKVNFDWSNIRKSYRSGNNDKTSVESVGTLMKAVGVALSANYGSANTSASLQNMKKALINNFSYKSSCFYLFNEMPDKRDFYSLIYKEIDNKRPVITASQGHAFVCDGYKDEFLHFNLGWDGVMNGYYRTNLNDDNGAEYLLTELIAGIEPERDSQVKEKMVELSEPGTLANHLSDEEVVSLNKLTVKGKINSSDIALIRRMSGAVDNNNLFRKIGVLESLDLSEAKIVKSDAPYYVTDASQAGFRVEMKKAGKNVVYDFSNITVSDWEEIYAKKAHVGKDYIIEKENDKYLMKLFA